MFQGTFCEPRYMRSRNQRFTRLIHRHMSVYPQAENADINRPVGGKPPAYSSGFRLRTSRFGPKTNVMSSLNRERFQKLFLQINLTAGGMQLRQASPLIYL